MPDERTYIRVHDGVMDHPKVDPLSDKAFRLLMAGWCYCSRYLTDGRMPAATWEKRGTKPARRELVAAGLVEVYADHVMWHDYLEHQRSASDVEEKRATKKRSGKLGNHQRWHVAKSVHDPRCEFCVESGPPEPPIDECEGDPPDHNGSHSGSHTDRERDHQTLSLNGNGHDSSLRSLTMVNTPDSTDKESPMEDQQTSGDQDKHQDSPSQTRSQPRSQTGRETSPEVRDRERSTYGDLVGGRPVTNGARAETKPPEVPPPTRPADRCTLHREVDDPPNCGSCGKARRAAEAWDSRHAEATRRELAQRRSDEAHQRAADRQAAIDNCDLCDDDGRLDGGQLCRHDLGPADAAERGSAQVRAILASRRAS